MKLHQKEIFAFYLMQFMAFAPLAWGAGAQDVNISATINPQQAAVGENLQLVLTIEGKVNINSAPQLPDLPDFQVYNGGRSSNFSFVNGQIYSSLNVTYVLVPKRAGTFTIAPITITFANQTYATQPLQVIIGGSGRAAMGNPGQPSAVGQAVRSNAPAPAVPAEHENEALFITTSVDRHEVYANQPITLTFRYFMRSQIVPMSQPQYQPPDVSGFWAEDLPPQREYVTNIQGQEYRVIEIKTALFPTTTGEHTIGPAQLVVQIQDFQRQNRDPFQDMFFRDFFSSGKQIALRSKPVHIKIKPLPAENRPSDFSGTVGQWSISAKLDRAEAKVGEAVTLEVRIFGSGNVKAVGKPELPEMPGFKVYDTVSSSEVQKKNDEVRGVKIYRTLLRPEVTGNLVIPTITFCYFNPQSDKYQTMKVPNLSLKVQAGDMAVMPINGTVSSVNPALTGNNTGVKMISQDIRYLKTRMPLQSDAAPMPAWVWVVGFLFPPLVLFGIWLRQRWQAKLLADPKYARRLAADKSSRQALRLAHRARVQKDTKLFYAQLALALIGYLADQMGLSRSGITQRELLQRLEKIGAAPALLQTLSELFAECDFARFAPADRDPGEMEQHENQAENLLLELGKIVRRERNI